MNWRWIIAGIAFVCATICVFVSNYYFWCMIDEVNRQLPESQQYSGLGWWAGNMYDLYQDHARLCPSASSRRRSIYFGIAGLICFIPTVWILFGPRIHNDLQ